MTTSRLQLALQRLSAAINDSISEMFYRLGQAVTKRPKTFMVASVLAAIALSLLAPAYWEEEGRAEKLWIPQDSRAKDDEAFVQARYEKSTRIISFYFTMQDGTNALTATTLESILDLHEAILDLQVPANPRVPCRPKKDADGEVVMEDVPEGTMCDLPSLCQLTSFTPPNTTTATTICRTYSILDLFTDPTTGAYSRPILNAHVPNLLEYINQRLQEEAVRVDGDGVDVARVLGGVREDGSGDVVEAKVLQLYYVLVANEVLTSGNQNEDLNAGAFEDAVRDLWESFQLPVNLEVEHRSEKFFEDEFSRAFDTDRMALQIGIVLLIVYASIIVGRFSKVQSRVSLALAGILSVGMAIGTSFGLSSAFGVVYTPLHGTMPFILLGIGVDDMFVIVGAFDRQDPSLDISERVSRTLRVAGSSVLVTSFTDFMAFMVGATTILPALSSFCIWTGLGILFDLVYFCTFFIGALTLDAKRQKAKRMDMLCCVTVTDPKPETCCDGPRSFLETGLAPALMVPAVQWVAVVVFAGLLGFGITGLTKLEMNFEREWFLPPGSDLFGYLDLEDSYFDQGQDVFYIFQQGTNYIDDSSNILALHDAIAENEWVDSGSVPVVTSWYLSFRDYVMEGSGGGGGAVFPPDETNVFYQELGEFLNSTGRRYTSDFGRSGLIRDPQTGAITDIVYSRISAVMTKHDNAADRVSAMDSLRATGDASGLAVTTFSNDFVFAEQFDVIEFETYRNLALSIAVIYAVTVVLIAHPLTATLVTLNVVMTIIDVLGTAHYWGLNINSVVVIFIVLAVGLSVDYSAHIGHHFMMHKGTRAERAKAAVSGVGGSVIAGATSTVVAVLVLSASQTYIFKVFFRMFLLTCVYGLAHGIIFLPIILSWIGPPPYDIDMEGDKTPTHKATARVEMPEKGPPSVRSGNTIVSPAEASKQGVQV